MPLMAEQCYGFLLAAILVTLSPGPDNLMVLSIGISRGRWRGVVFGLGCGLGCLSHTLLAALGISALVAASPVAFSVLKVVGGLYLIWLGTQALRNGGVARVDGEAAESLSLQRYFAKGLFANAINPKVVVFFLSFLPQFVDVGQGDAAMQTLWLGSIFTVQACLIFGLLGYFSGRVGHWLNRRAGVGRWLDRLAGAVFIGLGARLIFVR